MVGGVQKEYGSRVVKGGLERDRDGWGVTNVYMIVEEDGRRDQSDQQALQCNEIHQTVTHYFVTLQNLWMEHVLISTERMERGRIQTRGAGLIFDLSSLL